MRRLLTGLALAAALGAVAACNNGSSTPVNPNTPAPTTDTFSGNVAAAGTAAIPFSTAVAGEVDVFLTVGQNAAGTALPLIGWVNAPASDGSCPNLLATTTILQAGTSSNFISALSSGGGAFCVGLNNLSQTDAVSFTIQITHF